MNSKVFMTSMTTAAVVTLLASCTSSTDYVDVSRSSSDQREDGNPQVLLEAKDDSVRQAVTDSQSSSLEKEQALVDSYQATRPASKSRPYSAGDESTASTRDSDRRVAEVQQHLPAQPALMPSPEWPVDQIQHLQGTEKYQDINNHRVVVTANEPTSTFSIDVDSGAYSNMRRFINSGSLPPANAVRIEELVNYFSYDYHTPEQAELPFSINTELAPSPWNSKTHLLHVGLKGYEVDPSERPDANLVFLIDVSGSMGAANKLGLLKPAMRMLADKLTENDNVSIVVYAGASGVVLEPTAGNNTAAISRAINGLRSGGSTNGRAGIELAYDMAAKGFKKEGINRVLLATDGDFNVGLSDIDQLKALIEKKRESGIALTTLGFGAGNYNDHLMEQLADVGNGAYAYIDNLNEARKVLADEVTSTLITIAKDVKIQIEFNPAVVSEYRLIGYENRHLANEDFSNDKVDAGEIGAGHTVTAIYEIALVGDGGERNSAQRYGKVVPQGQHTDEIAELRLRYKAPGGNHSKLVSKLVKRDDRIEGDSTSDNFRFSAAVAALGQLLRDSAYMNGYSLEEVASLARSAKGVDEFGYRQEFTNLVQLTKTLAELRKAEVNPMLDDNRG